MSLPTKESHTCHPTGGGVAGFSKRINERVAAKIKELVGEGVIEIHEIRRLLRHFVMHDLCTDSHPDPNDRAYFPNNNDLRGFTTSHYNWLGRHKVFHMLVQLYG